MSEAAAALRLWKVQMRLASQAFTIPPRPASAWLTAILHGDATDLLDEADQTRLDELLDDELVDEVEVEHASYDAVTAAAGRPWHEALRLADLLSDPQARGELILAVDLDRVSLAAALDALYALLVRWMDKDKRAQFDAMLTAPQPPAMAGDPKAPRDPGEAARQAAAAMRQRSRDAAAARQQATGTPSAG